MALDGRPLGEKSPSARSGDDRAPLRRVRGHLSDGMRTTYLRDSAIVRANCHRMLHRGDLISVEELRGLTGRA
jgi:hypothetical protein